MSARSAIVRLFTTVDIPQHASPWRPALEMRSGGSGCIVAGRAILTCAHVAAHATRIEVQRADRDDKFAARLRKVESACELALLTVDDERFFDGAHELELGDIPAGGTPTTLYGHAVDGSMEPSHGTITRLVTRPYSWSQRYLLTLEADAPVVEGYSGGPALVDGKLVGIAFQGLAGSVHLVPPPLIARFLAADDPTIPDLGVCWQKIENDALRGYLGLAPGRTGVVVSRVIHGSSAESRIEPRDILTSIDGFAIDDLGFVSIDGHRMHFTHLATRRRIGETVRVGLVRRYADLSVDIVLRPYVALVPSRQPARPTRYLIVGGLAFVALGFDYMEAHADGNRSRILFRYLSYYYDRYPSESRKEIVVLARIFEHAINRGYRHMYNVALERVNGIEITELADVVRALAHPVSGCHVFEVDQDGDRTDSPDAAIDYGRLIVLDAAATEQATRDVLVQHEIACDRRL